MIKRNILLLSSLLALLPAPLYAKQTETAMQFLPSQSSSTITQQLNINELRFTLAQHGIDIGKNRAYYRALVQPVLEDGKTFLLIYLLENQVNGFKVIKAQLDANKNIEKIISPYHLSAQDLQQQIGRKKTSYCPDPKVNAVIASYFYDPTDPSSYDDTKAMNRIIKLSKLEGYKTVLLWNNASDPNKVDTVANEQNWLSCPNVKEVVINSHGSPSGFLAQDGVLSADYFNQYQQTTGHPLRAVITTNACEVMQDPIKSSIEAAGATGYIASTTSVLHKFSPEDLTFMAYQYFHNGGKISADNIKQMLSSVDPVHAKAYGIYWGGLGFGQVIDPDVTVTMKKPLRPIHGKAETTTAESGEVIFRFKNPGEHEVQSISIQQNGEKVICPFDGSSDYPINTKQPTLQINSDNGHCSATTADLGDLDDYIVDPDIATSQH